jgi:ABC-type Fe3+/spermidine/putrescine transport system ATPase subunit
VAKSALHETPTTSRNAETVLSLVNVSKSYGSVKAVDRVSIDVNEGEVLTLLGPSGCGKTTTLRMVIGLERCTEGEIFYEGRPVDSASTHLHVPTHKRNMGMVFQSYAIWPHMTVFENVAYPLRIRNVKGNTVRDNVQRVLEQVGLGGLGERPATMLSGGQQQRVALARSLVFEPKILLLDEPFSNLDAKLREQMRAELRVLQRRLGITVLFVTHDQIEALSLSDRIAVMNRGQVEQIGTPQELYLQPKSPIVRDFIGRTIVLQGKIAQKLGGHRLSVALLTGEWGEIAGWTDEAETYDVGQQCYVAIRPEQVQVDPSTGVERSGTTHNQIEGVIEALLFIGERYEARIALPWGESILVYLEPNTLWQENERVSVTFPAEQVRVWRA